MQQLFVAMPEKGAAKIFQRWDERSAGAWRNHVEVRYLIDDKTTNDGIVAGLAKLQGARVLASQHLTSAAVTRERTNVQRLKTYKLLDSVERWMDENDLDWRLRTTEHCKKTPFKCIPAEEWVAQFAKVDPKLGRRAGAALLAQFRVIGPNDFAEYFSDLPPVDLSTFFLGADPHSGDYGLITPLAANIDNALLKESRGLPHLKNGSKVRLYCDGSWSGGETQRRIRCMYTPCAKKANALNPAQFLDVRVGFITDAAETAIERALQQLIDTGIIQKGFVRVTCPEKNRLRLIGFRSGLKGLAFHNPSLLEYVDEDPKALQRLCRKIGEEISHKPLGTNEIASCIAFSHSLPAAMLPLFTVGGAQVTAADGQKFFWEPLLKSQHVSTGQDDDPDHHCEHCPLADRTAKTAQN